MFSSKIEERNSLFFGKKLLNRY